MKTHERLILMVPLCIAALMLTGCSKGRADESKPLSEVKAEAEKMDIAQLKQMALKYKDKIVAKQDDIAKIVKKLEAIPLTKKLGEEAKGLATEIKDLTGSMSALKERFQVYYDKLKEAKADVSDLKI